MAATREPGVTGTRGARRARQPENDMTPTRTLLRSFPLLTVAAALAAGCGGSMDGAVPTSAAQNGGSTSTTGGVTFQSAPTATSQVCPASTTTLCISARNRDGAPPEGGTSVLLVGTALTAQTAVTFGGVPAESVVYDASTNGILATTPPHANGFVDIVLVNPDGQTATSANFHYAPPPAIASYSPSIVRKGDPVTVIGSGFETVYGLQVNVGGVIATIVSRTADQVVFLAPKMNVGSYQFSIANFDGQYGVAPGLLTYP
jgi:hypothetical protein